MALFRFALGTVVFWFVGNAVCKRTDKSMHLCLNFALALNRLLWPRKWTVWTSSAPFGWPGTLFGKNVPPLEPPSGAPADRRSPGNRKRLTKVQFAATAYV